MIDRREFICSVGSAAIAAAVPLEAVALGTPALPHRPIPGTNESIAIVGLGNSAFYESDMVLSRQLIEVFLKHGGSYVDADLADAGKKLSRISRDLGAQEQLFFGTGVNEKKLPSLRQLVQNFIDIEGGGPLDMLQVATPEELEQHYDDFLALREEGLARYFGVARYAKQFYPAMMKAMEKGIVDFVQFNYSIMEPEAADDILPLAQETGTAVITNRPFIQGNYFNIVRGQELPEWASEFDCHSWAQFSLKYILAHPAVTCVISGTSSPTHLIDNLSAGYGRLPNPGQTQRMESVIRTLTA